MNTEIIRLDSDNPDAEAIKSAASIIDGGGLVGFPTETVYGIACRAKSSSLDRLDLVKARPGDKRYSLHIPDASAIDDYVPHLSLKGRKLIQNCWPGPLTVVFELSESDLAKQKQRLGDEVFEILYQGGTIGVRCPDNPIAIALLAAAKQPVVAPSANLSGKPPSVTADEVIDQLGGNIDMVIAPKNDSQACRCRQSSTVVIVSSGNISILREGAIKKQEIEEISAIRILFVCTGNTCRSPLAEYLCKKYIAEKLDCGLDEVREKGYKVSSVGLYVMEGMPASREVVEICFQKGIDATGHRSSTVTAARVEESDIIFAMTRAHCRGILEMCPSAESKCMLLDASGDVADPIGGGIRIYNECSRSIEQAIGIRLCEMMT